MKVLVIRPYCMPEVQEIDNDLKTMQGIVGGFVEFLGLRNGVTIVCNEEGKLMDLPVNRPVYDPDTGNLIDVICGTFFLCGDVDEEGELTDLPDKYLIEYNEFYNKIV